jgi:hypothetical protein
VSGLPLLPHVPLFHRLDTLNASLRHFDIRVLDTVPKRRRDDVERTRDAGVVHEDNRSAVRGRVVEGGETRLALRRAS